MNSSLISSPPKSHRQLLKIFIPLGALFLAAVLVSFIYLFHINSLLTAKETPVSQTTSSAKSVEKEKPALTAATAPKKKVTPAPAPVQPKPQADTASAAKTIKAESFSTPSQNISCELVGAPACTIHNYSFPSPAGCRDKSLTATLEKGKLVTSCTRPIQNAEIQPYGSTVENGKLACTIAESGVKCRDAGSGKAFIISREEISAS